MSIDLDFGAVLSQWPLLLQGVLWTVGLTAVSTVLGLLLGIAAAWARQEGPQPLRMVVGAYVELIRNTPFIIQLFFIFFGLPAIGVQLSPEVSSLIAMVANLTAYATEIVRAGLRATPRGQIEAAQSLAMNRAQVFLHVVLQPALRRVWPSLVSQVIIVMLGSAVCGQISTQELSYATNLIQSRNFRAFESFIVAAVLYLILSMLVRRLLNLLGSRWLGGSHG